MAVKKKNLEFFMSSFIYIFFVKKCNAGYLRPGEQYTTLYINLFRIIIKELHKSSIPR